MSGLLKGHLYRVFHPIIGRLLRTYANLISIQIQNSSTDTLINLLLENPAPVIDFVVLSATLGFYLSLLSLSFILYP